MTDPVQVIQADRMAAWPILHWAFDEPDEGRCMEGDFDDHFIVQAFARHREAATQSEREAIVAWMREQALQTPSWDHEISETLVAAANAIEAEEYRSKGDV